MTTLKSTLTDWTDWDLAQHHLARSLGLLPSSSTLPDSKALYWSDNPVGRALLTTLDALASANILDRREEPDLQYRWSAAPEVSS